MDKVDDFNFTAMEALTEIKENDMYLDEALKVIREDSNKQFSWGDKNKWYDWGCVNKHCMPDISFPCDSDFSVRAKKKVVKEVSAEQMMRDLKEKYGCEVKVTE